MASSTAFGTDPRNIALGDAVRRKRVQLDEEIEMFRALKEQEFRAFEERLRRGSGEVDVGRVEASLRGGRARIKVGKEKRERRGREREGEGEFEGVFTPRFLPLLGGERSLGDRSGFERVLFGKERGERLTDEGVETLRREEEERVKVERGWYDGGRRVGTRRRGSLLLLQDFRNREMKRRQRSLVRDSEVNPCSQAQQNIDAQI